MHGASLHFLAGIIEHGTCQDILGFGMGGDAETGHIDAHDPDPVDLIGKQPKRHARCCGNAQVRHHDGVIAFRIGHVVDRFADILEQLAGDQRLRIERHITDRPARAVEMRHKGQPIDATGRTAQHGGGAAHPQTHPQAAERRAHGLRLVMGTLGIILGVLVKDLGFARHPGGLFHFPGPGMASHAIPALRCGSRRDGVNDGLAPDHRGLGRVVVAHFSEIIGHRFTPRRR